MVTKEELRAKMLEKGDRKQGTPSKAAARAELLKRYMGSGVTVEELAKEAGCKASTIRANLKRAVEEGSGGGG